ncbi:MAG TPA: DUF2911 domain-containing protein [Gemmatimonadaceae bacterium]|nr:DUF2911 domain-containing protein [Gemmatimonadaceae bacterium]
MLPSSRLRAVASSLVLMVGAGVPLLAQGYPGSQRARVEQTIAFTDVSVVYGRPVARGRTLFGDSALVKWNAIWHPGADSATIVKFTHDVLLEGKDVKAGEYSVWLLPRATGPWTFILSRAAHVFHQPYPGEAQDYLRVDVAAERGAHMETMAFYFPVVLRDEAVMRIHWGDMIVPVKLKAPYRPQ